MIKRRSLFATLILAPLAKVFGVKPKRNNVDWLEARKAWTNEQVARDRILSLKKDPLNAEQMTLFFSQKQKALHEIIRRMNRKSYAV